LNPGPALGALLIGCALASTAIASETGEPAGFDYLYIVANEGGSSGGHAAIRFEDHVYHFQNEDDRLVLHRDLADEFLYDYALLGNRTIHSTHVAVSEETLRRILDRFRRRHRAQQAQLSVEADLRLDRVLLEFLADRQRDATTRAPDRLLAIPGLGYFASVPARAGTRSGSLDSLRREVVRAYGPGFFASRRRALAGAMRALLLEDPTAWPVGAPGSVDDHPPFARSYASRWVDLRAGTAALDVLERAPPLAAASHHAPDDAAFALDVDEVAALARYATRLSRQLVEVVDSRRSDWGQTLLVGMARLVALHQSIASGRLVFLDTFPDAPGSVATLEPHGARAARLLAENRRQLEASLEWLRKRAAPGELAWERVEERSNRYYEMLRAEHGGGELRVARGHLVPSRTGRYPLDAAPSALGVTFSEAARRARERERSYSRELGALHRYDLITRNCATAIFDTLNASLGGSVEDSRRQLGGHVGGPASLAFIPFVSARLVNERYRVTRRETIRSYRERRLAEMKERESPVRVALRESNTLTAKSYLRDPDDSFFVFFTDEAPLLRPIFGAVNLVAAVGETVVGLATAPADRGALLVRGLRGALFSLPELAFVNIRKGSNDWIPADERDLDPVLVAEASRDAPAREEPARAE
jgi:hypothetical protein